MLSSIPTRETLAQASITMPKLAGFYFDQAQAQVKLKTPSIFSTRAGKRPG
jgi:hypothetical protein